MALARGDAQQGRVRGALHLDCLARDVEVDSVNGDDESGLGRVRRRLLAAQRGSW